MLQPELSRGRWRKGKGETLVALNFKEKEEDDVDEVRIAVKTRRRLLSVTNDWSDFSYIGPRYVERSR